MTATGFGTCCAKSDEEMTPRKREAQKARVVGMLEEVRRLDEDNKAMQATALSARRHRLGGGNGLETPGSAKQRTDREPAQRPAAWTSARSTASLTNCISVWRRSKSAKRTWSTACCTCGKPFQELKPLYDAAQRRWREHWIALSRSSTCLRQELSGPRCTGPSRRKNEITRLEMEAKMDSRSLRQILRRVETG